jgi:flagellar basal-body rod protein FlgB
MEDRTAVAIFDTTQIALDQAMAGAATRQKAISDNIANANTPGYKRTDVDFQAQLQQALAGGDDDSQLESLQFTPSVDTTSIARADVNTVDIAEEMANLSENTLDYQTLESVARARIQMLQTVLGSR